MSTHFTLEALGALSFFEGLSAEHLTRLLSLVERRSFALDALVFTEGTPREALAVVARGTVTVERTVAGRLVRLFSYGPGEPVGESLLFEEQGHTASTRALTGVELAWVSTAALAALRRDTPALYAELVSRAARVQAARLRRTTLATLSASPPVALPATTATRREKDLLGERELPDEVLYGVQTLRALENFPITGTTLREFPALIAALAVIKEAAALANRDLGLLDDQRCDVIVRACRELRAGRHHEHFPVDMVQGGAGTSTNMNANEVIANRALELLGKPRGAYDFVNPNNDVNCSQSTNDVYPTAIKLAMHQHISELQEALRRLAAAFARKGTEFAKLLKVGRTQLQDAVPMTLGQEFSGFGITLLEDVERLGEAQALIREMNLGATAIGTGLNAPEGYAEAVRLHLSALTGLTLITAPHLVEATSDTGSFVQLSGVLKRNAVKLSKICNDLRLLSSGPRAGLGEIQLPPMQPGSSIMPGKVNPVIPEVVNQVCFDIVGGDMTVTMAAEAGQLQLNAFEPIIAFRLLRGMDALRRAVEVLRERCVEGITADADRLRWMVEHSIGLVTALVPQIGYAQASDIAKTALKTGRGVVELVRERGLMTGDELARALDPYRLAGVKPQDETAPRAADIDEGSAKPT
ncbi:MAG TPA: aspartate ammonia-lyase [Aggregicoccus sp.]|nr:aspartate ammonia-lyase [Aggregicoccus sp.]